MRAARTYETGGAVGKGGKGGKSGKGGGSSY